MVHEQPPSALINDGAITAIKHVDDAVADYAATGGASARVDCAVAIHRHATK